MRVLHGVTGAANQPATISRFQRERGVDAQCLTVSAGGFGYAADIQLEIGPDAQRSYSDFLRENIDRYDIFHFYFRSFFFFDPRNNAFPSGLDLLLLRAAGKTVIVHYRGSEVREASRFRELSPFNYVAENPSGIFTKFTEPSLSRRVDYVRSVANAVLVPDEELQSYVPGSRIVRRAIDLRNLSPTERPRKARPLVLHAPSRRIVKGTDSIVVAVDKLKAEGLDFDFRLVENLPHSEAMELYRQADVVIDQLRIGWFGVFALEAMALKRCVLAYVREDLLGALGDEPPLVTTSPENLVVDLRRVIKSESLREEMGERGRRYVELHHDAANIARELEVLYTEPAVAEAQVDVSGVLDFLIVQRDDTKAMYGKKSASRTATAPSLRATDLVAQFKRTRAAYGTRETLRRTARWGSVRTAAFLRGLG